MARISFDEICWEEPTPRVRRRSRAWLSHVGPALVIAAGVAMWAAAVVWLLVRMAQ